jgi:hypothetical protein
MNKVRLDKQFQNPLLRLGRAGNTYSKILSTASMERIKEHYRAVKSSYGEVESNITESVSGLKTQIEGSIAAFEKISLNDISEFAGLEAEILSIKGLPVDLEELHADVLSDNIIVRNREGGEGYWTRIGAAWAHKNGNGFNIQLETVPLDGRITLRIASEKSE